MNKDTKSKIAKIKQIKDDYISFLSATIKKRNKKIEEIIKKNDDAKIRDILNNIK